MILIKITKNMKTQKEILNKTVKQIKTHFKRTKFQEKLIIIEINTNAHQQNRKEIA